MPFQNVDLRVARILKVSPFPKARKPAYQLELSFGPHGTRRSSAQLPPAYPDPSTLQNLLVVCVFNFQERKVAGFASQVLTLGMNDGEEKAWLAGWPGDKERWVGKRLVLEGDSAAGESNGGAALPIIEVQEFMDCGIAEKDGFVVLPGGDGTKRLGLVDDDGTFVPLLAPIQSVKGTILH
jgi:tRNA-binding protein